MLLVVSAVGENVRVKVRGPRHRAGRPGPAECVTFAYPGNDNDTHVFQRGIKQSPRVIISHLITVEKRIKLKGPGHWSVALAVLPSVGSYQMSLLWGSILIAVTLKRGFS